MLIIFEGVDYTGKTSISKRLSVEIDADIYTPDFNKIKTYSEESNLQEFAAISHGMSMAAIKMEEFTKKDLILDRSYLTEYVYSQLNINGERKQRDGLFKVFKEELEKRDTVLVYLVAKDNDIIERMNCLDDGDIKMSEIKKVERKYEEVISRLDLPVFVVNTSIMDVKYCTESIIKSLQDLYFKRKEKR